ncbi:MAG TPA: tetratricopeptide repeat protein, partial [Candidatus Deferrimicrobium sp.]|nr:tetratricopeptide repeat protein [Candidatus Deferrimicrobium sp.]
MPRPKRKQRQLKSHRYAVRRSRPARAHSSASSLDSLPAIVQAEPNNVSARMELAEHYLQNDQEDKILEVLRGLEDWYSFFDKFQRGYYNRLMAFGHAHRSQLLEAEKAAHLGLEEFPNSLDFHFVLCYVHLSLKEIDQSIASGERFVSLWNEIRDGRTAPPDFSFTGRHAAQLFNILGTAYREKGDFASAQEFYKKAIDSGPGDHLPYINLATLLRHLGESDKAEKVIKQGLKRCRQCDELRTLSRQGELHATISACMIVKNEEELL